MTKNTFISIDSDALQAKSKVYISRALKRKSIKDFDEYQLWASLALELLGKAALSKRHPSLVIDPNHWQSLFVAAGINTTTDVKTISAKTLFERLKHLVPKFDNNVQKFCQGIAERRNAELHSADAPFRTMKLEAWEANYWHTCDTILNEIESSLEDWVGANDAKAPRQLIEEAVRALGGAIKIRVQAASEGFKSLNTAERRRLIKNAKIYGGRDQELLFQGAYDLIWTAICPSCEAAACMAGEQVGEDISHESDEDAIWEIVDREFVGEAFRCFVCELSLTGQSEIEAAGLDYLHYDQHEREMEYEPDYGND